MFADATAFNGDISKWNVEKVTDMSYMSEPIVERPTASKTKLNQPSEPKDGSVHPKPVHRIEIDGPQRVGSSDNLKLVQKIEDIEIASARPSKLHPQSSPLPIIPLSSRRIFHGSSEFANLLCRSTREVIAS